MTSDLRRTESLEEQIENHRQQLDAIEARNKRVEQDKAWEISLTRKMVIATITYFTIALILWITKLPTPLLNAIIPTLGFLLSTYSIPIIKKYWLKLT